MDSMASVIEKSFSGATGVGPVPILLLAGDLRSHLVSGFEDTVSLPIFHVDEGSLNWPRSEGLNFARL